MQKLVKFLNDYVSTDLHGKDVTETGAVIDISDEDEYGDGKKRLSRL
ncbi:hypothetical protein [Campylobacter jejuni]|nr:hypothetical protein [Campylobacter jejuni]